MYPRLSLFAPPYTDLQPISTNWTPTEPSVGHALIWRPTADGIAERELDFVEARPRGYSLAIVLPAPDDIASIAQHLHRLGTLRSQAVLPSVGMLDQPPFIKSALAIMPRGLSEQVGFYLDRHCIVIDRKARREIRRIFELAPKVGTISKLCREMYTSRRTLGRHFEAEKLPVPSHWLQFARILHVVLRSHSERTAFFRLATSVGYPDGFTLSNQMKRMTGFRPSEIRGLYGFEWLLETWLKREADGLLNPRANDERADSDAA